ncbi:putative monooxygenase [Hypoxylon trugodes]|uniref:putative monooxygenase n=1 Tax=Hypoxylon trugodes TaxID=326681 RepID=UPI00219F7928|nr:putative monooxygenase [Hypoxylon trugodes]KAI1385955.1 putative monooxygenase [Hypoxylon trugodes]
MDTKTTKPRVLIVGAGLGALTLAQGLRKHGIPFEIFERDKDPISRSSGWCIALHTVNESTSMINDLIASAPDDMPPFRESVDHLVPLDLNAQVGIYRQGMRLGVESTPDYPVIRANRGRLRKWLSTRVPIQWGKKVVQVEEIGDEVQVRLEDGTTVTGDIVVGADGVHSVVREYVLQRPNKTILQTVPAAMITGETVVSGAAFERQLSLGHSSWTVSGPEDSGYYLFVGLRQVSPDGKSGEYYWFIVVRDENVDKEDHWLRVASQSEKLRRAFEICQTLDPKYSEIIRLTPPSGMWTSPLIVRDVELRDLPVGRVTLLGDAVHPMTPFRGEGGVHAIIDALNLGKALGRLKSTDIDSIKAIVGPYQEEIIERGVSAVRVCRYAQNVNSGGKGEMIVWSKIATPMPEEKISLGTAPFLKRTSHI